MRGENLSEAVTDPIMGSSSTGGMDLKLFYPPIKPAPKCHLPDDHSAIFDRVENFRAKRQSTVESILFKDIGVAQKKSARKQREGNSSNISQSQEVFDSREQELLKEEQTRYVSYLADLFKDYFPGEVVSKEAFDCRAALKSRKTRRVSKKAQGERAEGSQSEESDNVFGSEDEEGSDDYDINDYEGEDDPPEDDYQDERGGGDY